MNTQQSTSLCDIKFKIVFLGQMGVGKTSIIQRFIRNQFQAQNNPTVGIDFLTRNINYKGQTYRLQLWDTAGQQKYRSLVPAYLRDAHCAVFVFDIHNKDSLETLKAWIQLFRDHQPQKAAAVLIGNKADLNFNRQISMQDAQNFAKGQQMQYLEVSAKQNVKIIDLFQTVIDSINEEVLKVKLQKDGKKITVSEQEKISQQFFLKYSQLKTKKAILKNVPCCYI